MDQNRFAVDWIGAYLEWSNSDDPAAGSSSFRSNGIVEPSADAGGEFPAAYFEWMDAIEPARQADFREYAIAAAADSGGGGAAGERDAFREVTLLAALQTEADCVHILRRILDGGGATPGTVKLVCEAIGHAERLLEEEQSAWHALTGLRRGDLPQWRATAPTNFAADWPHALEDVAADVRALTGKVLGAASPVA